MKSKEKAEEMKKKREEEEAKRKQEEERKRRQQEEDALPAEEKVKIALKKQAEAKKNEGNDHYKKKDFPMAIKLYDEAIALDQNEVLFYNNKATVFYEMKDFDKCIEISDKAIELSKGGNYDYVKLGKALARKAAARLAQGHFDDAIDLYKQSLLENGDANVKTQLKNAEKAKKEDEERKMINPEMAEELRKEGNAFYEKADYPNAVKTYSEGLKRDPNSKAIYANRSAAYIKLMEFPHAMKDAEKCLQLDPNFAKAYLRKGTCHHFMKEYHKALEAFDRGLKLDPENKELNESRMRTMQIINSSAYASSGEHDEERLRHAAADPEIQLLMRDPRIVQVLKDMQENPVAAQGALRDPFINTAINKLIAAGIIKMA
jgi:stress-induced-phosphoprotein 1